MATKPLHQSRTIWDILNATDRYRREDIKAGAWRAMYGVYGDNDRWKQVLQNDACWHKPANAWERELIRYMLNPRPAFPRPKGNAAYIIAVKIIAILKHRKAAEDTLVAALLTTTV